MHGSCCTPRSTGFSTSIMNIYSQSYDLATTPTERSNKVGWYHDILAKRLHLSVLLIGDSIARLGRYQMVWKKYFKTYKSLNYGIHGE